MINYDMGSPFPIGTVATYTCDPGFELIGEVTRTCEDGGAGVGGVFGGSAPFCQGEYASVEEFTTLLLKNITSCQ